MINNKTKLVFINLIFAVAECSMKSVIATFLSFLLLSTNVGLTFATHYCKGKAVKAGLVLGQEDLRCGMTDKESTCEKHPEAPTLTSKGCCENQYVQFEIEDDYNSSNIVETPVQMDSVAAFIISYINLYSIDALVDAEYLNYAPPLLDLDISVLIQSFLL